MSAYAELRADLLAWVQAWQRGDPAADDPSGARLEALALRVFAWQYQHIPAFGAFCRARGATPETVDRLDAVPLVPVTAFKTAELSTPLAVADPVAVFETSGTSDGRPGRVHLHDPGPYDASLHATFARYLVPEAASWQGQKRFRCLSLVPTVRARPRSSLGYMVRRLAARWDDGGGSEHLGRAGDAEALDLPGFQAACQRAASDGRPVLLFATSLALALLLEGLPAGWRVQLPAGSRLMDTGGPKGRHLQLSRPEQHARLVETLGLDPDALVGELGMTELCSQRYETTWRHKQIGDVPGLRAYAGPPWLVSRVLDPSDRSPLPAGEIGMVAHVDLANLETCAFVLTADLGSVDQRGWLTLAGRIPGSEWRGCGLDAEALVLGPSQ